MQTDFVRPLLMRSILASAFSGVVITLINLFYNAGYREIEGFSKVLLVNVSTIIFGTMILLMAMGFLFYLIAKYISRGNLVFIVLVVAITVLLVILTANSRSLRLTSGSDGLLIGLELITRITTALLIPYFAEHTEMIS